MNDIPAIVPTEPHPAILAQMGATRIGLFKRLCTDVKAHYVVDIDPKDPLHGKTGDDARRAGERRMATRRTLPERLITDDIDRALRAVENLETAFFAELDARDVKDPMVRALAFDFFAARAWIDMTTEPPEAPQKNAKPERQIRSDLQVETDIALAMLAAAGPILDASGAAVERATAAHRDA